VLCLAAACLGNDDVPPPRIAGISPDHGRPDTAVVVMGSSFCQQPPSRPDEETDPLACRLMGTLQFGVEPGAGARYTDTSISASVRAVAPGRVLVHLDVGGRSSNAVAFVVE